MYELFRKGKENALICLCFLLIGISTVFASWWMLHDNINFHTDIARDFLLFEDIYFNRNITLLGPRSGGISGVFHGPLWLYINIPAYALGNGNPTIVGWFWVLLYVLSIGTVYVITRLLFSSREAFISASLFSIAGASSIPFLFNPYGALMLAPIFFYGAWKYIEKSTFWFLILAILSLGFSIQFQMAWAVPILVLITPVFIYLIFKRRQYIHLFAFLLLGIPLSSFVLFEIRNNFLQTQAVLSYITGGENATKMQIPLYLFFWKRMVAMTYEAVGQLTGYNTGVSMLLIGLFVYIYKTTSEHKRVFLLFIYLYLGYWIITLPYKGTIWGYYYWPFLSIIAVVAGVLICKLPRRLSIIVFLLVYLSSAIYTYKIIVKPFSADDTSIWKFYKTAAEKVYNDAPNEFGYFIYTTDQFGYSSRYGMNYVQRLNPEKKAYPYEKKAVTYLLIDDPGDHRYTNHKGWRQFDVKIQKKPVKRIQLSKNYWIEKYELTQEEIAVSSNPNLIQNLIFR